MNRNKKIWTGAVVCLAAVVIAGICAGVVIGTSNKTENGREFTIDHERNIFLMDGEPFRYVSGSFHYFRAFPEVWRNRLITMRAAGLNALDTYVEWALHNPHDGEYVWTGMADLEKFIQIATEEGFYIIFRPGPYICAERDNGGVPHWLFTKYPNIKLRTSDPNYLYEVKKWYAQLMPLIQKYLYGNGGNIIMVQVENEYGVFHACDKEYLEWLRDETEAYVKGNALLFTTDIPNDRISCGKIENVFATTDFGIDRIHEIEDIWRTLRTIQKTGPLVNSEFYPGWLTHWQEENQRRDPQKVAEALKTILSYNASVNIYMFFGGTNFGFTAGANDFGYGDYNADITSYDYDAVMDEAGNKTEKYRMVSDVISEFLQIPNIANSDLADKAFAYGKVEMTPIARVFSGIGRASLIKSESKASQKPPTFEEMNQYSGLLLYETTLPDIKIDPTLLTINDLRDRAFVYVDEKLVGTLSRENKIYSLPVSKGWGTRLQILVENQGRINFNVANDTKGIFGEVTIQQSFGTLHNLTQWNTTSYPLDNIDIEVLLSQLSKYKDSDSTMSSTANSGVLLNGPVIYHGEFEVSELADSYLNTRGWGKGVVYLNEFNLGRYWPLVGPQISVYIPRPLLKKGTNTLVFIEYQRSNWIDELKTNLAVFEDKPRLDND